MSAGRPWLFLCRKPPQGSAYGAACLEVLLTAAAFDRPVVLAFAGEGVHQLMAGQDSTEIGLKDHSRVLPALELYEVHEVLVEAAALEERGLGTEGLAIPARAVDAGALGALMEEAEQVFVF